VIIIFSGRMKHFAVIEVYAQMINLAFPIISIAVAAGIYHILLGATKVAYTTLNSQLASLGNTLTEATQKMLLR